MYEIKSFNYSGGSYSVELVVDRDKDKPMPTTPEKIVDALRSLQDVQQVGYDGYTLSEEKIDEEDQKEGEAIMDDEGNEIGKKDPETSKKQIKMTLVVKMNGDKIDVADIAGEKEAK